MMMVKMWRGEIPLFRNCHTGRPLVPHQHCCQQFKPRWSQKLWWSWWWRSWWWGILVILVMLQVWLEKNWKQWSVCFGCIFDMGLHWLKWEKKWASLKKISTLIFGNMFDFFVPRRSWQFPVKSDAKASISFARPWNSP